MILWLIAVPVVLLLGGAAGFLLGRFAVMARLAASEAARTTEAAAAAVQKELLLKQLEEQKSASEKLLQEQKNVALKKVFGLGRGSVLMELIGSFMKMVGIAVLIGVPVGWWIINHWLQEFSYRIPIYWWLFAGSALLTGLLSLAAVLWQSIKTANTNPAVILKKD